MCGIAGHVSFSEPPGQTAVAALVKGVRHRGPDDEGIWTSEDGTCVLGHTRLSIIDLSPLGHQPMVDSVSGNCIVFNGEIYNFQTLRRECEAAGDVFLSQTDTEVILALYRRYGIDCLQRLRGMFAFALWDKSNRKIVLARDRVGKKPLNYAATREGIVFCSELGPLARHASISGEMDMGALELYLQCQFIPAPWSIYKEIRKLPPAHYAIFDENGLTVRRYWEVDYRQKQDLDDAAALEAFEHELTEAVRLRMVADVPLGALLSGGVDSSVIVALMAKLSGEPVRTFSIGFMEAAFNELPWAEKAAAASGTLHYPEVVRGDILHLIPTVVRHYGEPFGDSSAIPSFAVSAIARRHVTVVLNGDGGDELLGGYPRYWLSDSALRSSERYGGLVSPSRIADLAPLLRSARSIPMRALRKLLTRAHPEIGSVLMYTGVCDDFVRGQLLPNAVPQLMRNWRREVMEGASQHADSAVDRMLWIDNNVYLPGDLMVKMDIASMHCGLETRSPLLDHKVIEFCATLRPNHKVRGGVGKYLLKRLAERYFPRDFVHRRKMGFGIPVADWLRGHLREALHDTLRDPKLMAPLSKAVIERLLAEFAAGNDEHKDTLWGLLIFGIWRSQQGQSSA